MTVTTAPTGGATHLSRLRLVDTTRTRTPVGRRGRSRGVPTALADHPVAAADDPAGATGFVSDLLGPATLAVDAGQLGAFHATLHAVRALDVTLAHLDLGAPCTVDVPRAADAFSVHMTTCGEATATLGGEPHTISPFRALVVSPGTRYRLHLAMDSPQLVVRLERAAVERQLARMLGRSLREPLVLSPVADLTADAAVRWHGALQILSSEVLSPGSLLRRGAGSEALGDLLVSTLLHLQEHAYSDALRRRRGPSGRPAVRRSLDYIAGHLAERITLDDLAAHARMSARTIQAGFRADLGTTPVAYIRDQRLLRVRAALMEAVPGDGLTVTEAAERWGFGHPGSFSVLYRHRFGESPSATLRG